MKPNRFLVHRISNQLHKRLFLKSGTSPWRRRWWAVFYVFVIGIWGLFSLILLLSPTIPQVDNLQYLMAAQSSVILDRYGELLYRIHGEENRKVVPLDQISSHLIHATLATEDDRFFEHEGFDLPGILKAICGELKLCPRRGGSTITQQFAKNAFLTPERTYIRKLKEAILTVRLERRFDKEQILEMYLNRINYGSNIYGVELASQTFFGKSAKELDILEAAILAAIPKAPTFYSPYGAHQYASINLLDEEILKLDINSEEALVALNPEFLNKGLLRKTYVFSDGRKIYVRGRVDLVLDRMRELGMITPLEYQEARAGAEDKVFKPFREASFLAPHFVLLVKELLEEQYGKETIERGGFKITTTLDSTFQKAAEEAAVRYAEDNEKRLGATNASLVAVDPNNGQILAMVGSRDFFNDEIDGKVNVSLRPRLPGSSFKPIVYAAAFLKGYAPATALYDVKTKFGDEYEPDNFDGTFQGPMSMRRALAHSRNIPAVKAAYLAGISNVIDLARRMGINLNQPDDWYGLSLALGAGEVRLLDLVLAYSVFANGGYKMDPVVFLKVEDRDGNILEEYESPETKKLILDPQVAYLINHILSDVEARPEGFWRDILTISGQKNGAKTGTSNKQVKNATPSVEDDNLPFDAWTVGYTPFLAAGVWAGNNDGTPLKPKGDGLNAAGRIWHDFMVEATRGKSVEDFDRPEGIRFVPVSKRSGKLPSEFTPPNEVATEVFASFSVPTEIDNAYQVVEIDKVSGKLATEYTPLPARAKKAFFEHHSEFPDRPEWEDPVQAWAQENGQDEKPPTEYDDIHTAGSDDVKPEIRIVSPAPASALALPYVGVVVDINSSIGVAQVDYYWDDTLFETVKIAPFRGRLTIPVKENSLGSRHVIRAVVFDSLYRSNQASVEVQVGEDVLPPEVRFTYPTEGANLISGSLMAAHVDALDLNGDIQKVEWYLNGERQDIGRTPPYIWSFIVPDTAGELVLKAVAYDYAENQAAVELKLNITTQNFSGFSGNTRLIQPTTNQSFDPGEPITLKAYLDDAVRTDFKSLMVLAKPAKGNSVTIAELAQPTGTPFYTLFWGAPPIGQHELFLKIVLKNGEVRFSERVLVTVQ